MAFFTIILAHQFGSAVFGEYTYIASIEVIGNVITTFGIDMLLVREIAATDRLLYLFPALVIQILLSIIFIVIVPIVSIHLPNLDLNAVIALRIYSFSMVPLAFFTIFTTIIRGKQRMASYASLNLALIILQLTALFLLRLQGGGIIVLAILLLSVQVIGAILAGHLCQFQIQFFSQPFLDLVRQLFYLIRICAPIAVLGLLGILYQRLSLIIILSLNGTTSTGDYSAAARVVEAAKIGHVAIFTALYPLMAQVNATGKLNWASTFRLPILVLLGGAITASFILSWLAKPSISILFGSGYISSVSPLQVLSWILVPYTINSFRSLVFLAEDDVFIIMLSLMAGIITLVILTIWLEPLMNLKGAAWAALFSESLQSLILIGRYFQRHCNILIGSFN